MKCTLPSLFFKCVISHSTLLTLHTQTLCKLLSPTDCCKHGSSDGKLTKTQIQTCSLPCQMFSLLSAVLSLLLYGLHLWQWNEQCFPHCSSVWGYILYNSCKMYAYNPVSSLGMEHYKIKTSM